MRNLALLVTRLVVGGYLSAHGAQKLFGAFGGRGLDATGKMFERMGLTPGKPMAVAVGAAELGGGLLTATGIADPLGPLAVMWAMSVASATHRKNGPLAATNGFELPLTNLAAAAALVGTGAGQFRVGRPLSRRLTVTAAAGSATLAAVTFTKLRRFRRDEQPGATEPSEAERRVAPVGRQRAVPTSQPPQPEALGAPAGRRRPRATGNPRDPRTWW